MTATDPVIARLSALTEDLALDYFWLMTRRGADRRELLKQLCQVQIDRPARWNPRDVRRSFRQIGWVVDVQGGCFACRARGRQIHRHHVIQIANGGSNAHRNIIPLCARCHRSLHPWLTDERPMRRRFQQVTGVVGQFLDMLARVTGGGIR